MFANIHVITAHKDRLFYNFCWPCTYCKCTPLTLDVWQLITCFTHTPSVDLMDLLCHHQYDHWLPSRRLCRAISLWLHVIPYKKRLTLFVLVLCSARNEWWRTVMYFDMQLRQKGSSWSSTIPPWPVCYHVLTGRVACEAFSCDQPMPRGLNLIVMFVIQSTIDWVY